MAPRRTRARDASAGVPSRASAARLGGTLFARDTCIAIAILTMLATIADMVRDTTGLSAHPVYLAHAAGYAVLFAVLFRVGFWFLDWMARPSASRGALLEVPDRYGARAIARLAAIIFVCWLPWLVLTFPGVIWYDARQQLLQFFGLPNVFTSGALSDHHPVFDTLLYGSFVQVGRWFGSADVGAYLFCLVQAAATAAALGACVILVRRAGATSRTLMALLAVLCFFPHLPLYASAMAKDATFLPFMLAFAVVYIEAVRSRGQTLASPRGMVLFCGLALTMCLTRKTGLIIVVIICASLAICLHRHRVRGTRGPAKPPMRSTMRGHGRPDERFRALICPMAVPLVALGISALLMFVIMPFVALPALEAKPGGVQEVYGLLFQQSARVVREHGDELPPEELEVIETTLGDDVAQRYAWWITDTVKDETIDTPLGERVGSYLPVWAAQAVRYPVTTLEAYLATQVGWYAVPTMGDGSYIMYGTPIDAHEMDHTFAGSSAIGFTWSDTTIGTALEAIDEWVQGTPLGMIVLSKGFWNTWMLAFLIVACRHRCPERMIWLVPLIAANAVLWISPTSVTREAMRYLMPLLYLVPVSCALIARGGTSRAEG